jgi:hypothetical protein
MNVLTASVRDILLANARKPWLDMNKHLQRGVRLQRKLIHRMLKAGLKKGLTELEIIRKIIPTLTM